MSGELIDVAERFRLRGLKQVDAEIDQIASVQNFMVPVSTQKEIAVLVTETIEERDPALLGVVDYHRELFLGFIARSGMEFRTRRIVEDTINDLETFIYRDNEEPKKSFLTVQRSDAGRGDWTHFNILTLSDINKHAGEIIQGYRVAKPRHKDTDGKSSDRVLKAAVVRTVYEQFAKGVTAGAFSANKYGKYQHGINVHSGYYESEGLQTALVTDRLRGKNFVGSYAQEAARFIVGVGLMGMATEMTRNGLSDDELTYKIVRNIANRWRNKIKEGTPLCKIQDWLVGSAYPYCEENILETLRSFKSIEQPPLSDGPFSEAVERTFGRSRKKPVQ